MCGVAARAHFSLDAWEARCRARFLANDSERRSRCSFNRWMSSLWYSAASVLERSCLRFERAAMRRLRCSLAGVIRRWMLGACGQCGAAALRQLCVGRATALRPVNSLCPDRVATQATDNRCSECKQRKIN